MASKEEGKVEMDSLFEGMVLFDPSQMPDDDQLLQEQPHPPPNLIVPQTPPPSDSNWAGTSLPASQPLDENLFSDLTLTTPSPLQNQLSLQPQSDTPTTSSTIDNAATTTISNREVLPSSSSVSRQISSRKKRRPGLRIGYGRDVPIPDDQPYGPAAVPAAQQHADGRLSLEPELPPPPPSSFAPESEPDGSAPQPQLKENRPPAPDPQIATLSFTPGQPVPPSSTLALESHFPVNTRKEVDPSHASAGNGSQDDDSLVLDAQHSADLQAGNHQLSTHSPIESMRCEQIRAQISQKFRRVRELIASVSAARKDATRRRRNAAEALNLASSSYRKLEKALEEACEAEDFETAERVSESLASAEKEKESLAVALRLAEADCDSVDAKMQEVLEWQIAAEEECASLLKNFAMEAANDADLLLKNAEVASEKEMNNWISLTEDLELKKTELDLESCLINAARLVLSDSIEHSVSDDRRERELLCKRKEILTEELEKLLALVKEKEAEIAETDSTIETVEKRIIDVVSSFQEAQLSVDAKYDNLQAGLSQMELDNEALTRKKNEIDDFLSQEKDRGAKLQQLSQVSTDEANMYQEAVELRKSLVLFILNSREDKVRLAKTEEKLSEDVHMLIQEISATRAYLQDLSSTRSSFQQEIEFSKQRLVFINKRLPELEAEKKVAATARNFKEAARIATESKALNAEKEGLQIKMAGDILELGKIEEEISNTVSKLHETERQISTKEKEVAMARFQRLLLIAGAAKAERSTSLELGDVKEADALLAEAEAAESEARKIQLVYNFKEEEFANLPKQYISMELVSSLGGEQLAELAAFATCKSI